MPRSSAVTASPLLLKPITILPNRSFQFGRHEPESIVRGQPPELRRREAEHSEAALDRKMSLVGEVGDGVCRVVAQRCVAGSRQCD